MDIVYVLGSGSLANNNELRYSLRSLYENMLDIGKVFIVGDDPGFLPPHMLISAPDSYPEKWKNAYSKIRLMCEFESLSDEFLLMNDDFFMLEPFTGETWPFYALKGSNGGTCGHHSFHIHAPIRFNKEMFLKMPLSIDEKGCRSPRTFYGNFYQAPPSFGGDFVLRVGKAMRDFDVQIKDWPCFSISNSAMLDMDFVEWLDSLYPKPLTIEKS